MKMRIYFWINIGSLILLSTAAMHWYLAYLRTGELINLVFVGADVLFALLAATLATIIHNQIKFNAMQVVK